MTATPEVIRFSVVIATLRRPDTLRRALTSLAACTPPPDEIVVVDGDEDRSAEPIAEQAGSGPVPIRYVPAERGLTRQRNVGLTVASGDVVVFIDDDATLFGDAFTRLEGAFADPDVVGASGRVEEPHSTRIGGKTSKLRAIVPGGGREGQFTRYGYPRRLIHPDVSRDVEFMPGCLMAARLEVARRVMFDETLPGYGLAEDEDFSYRLSRLGRVRHLGDLVVRHENAGFGGRDRRAFGRQVVRNRAYLFRKNFPVTPRAQAGFAGLLGLLVVHRLVNLDWKGALGIAEGAVMTRLGTRV
jgi:glycosyltransferase involved in cell wall biosynthesis